jgi:hypothetical protein
MDRIVSHRIAALVGNRQLPLGPSLRNVEPGVETSPSALAGRMPVNYGLDVTVPLPVSVFPVHWAFRRPMRRNSGRM